MNGDGEIVWGPDAKLTPLGIEQAGLVNALWKSQVQLDIPTPDVIYTSPFRRAIHTAVLSFRGWFDAYEEDPGLEVSKNAIKLVLEVICSS